MSQNDKKVDLTLAKMTQNKPKRSKISQKTPKIEA